MNNRALLGRYFRQQAEMGMPDCIGQPALLQLLTTPPLPAPVAPLPVKTVVPLKTAAAQNTIPHPPQRTAAPPIKNRLATLRPAEQIVVRPAIPAAETAGAPVSEADKRTRLKGLFLTGCTACHLSATRKKFVFGAGNAEAPVMIIGEAPGQEEDEQGLPFVGAAGKLLTTMLQAIGLDRANDTFITNVIKCRPPDNRNPESAEIITCIPLLKQQIDIIRPKAILLLGRIAAHAVLERTDSIAKLRTRVFDYTGIPCMVIYHPAALLRNAEYKRPAWEDLQQFQKLLASLGVYGSLRKE